MANDRANEEQSESQGLTFPERAQSRHDFLVSDRLLLSPEHMIKYADRWVAAQRGEVTADDESFDGLLGNLKDRGISLATVAIRFIEKDGMAAP